MAATRSKAHREKVAQHLLEQAGYEVYLPKVRWRTSRNRASRVSPPFPGYLFTRIELQWHSSLPGVIKPVMNGEEPSRVPDETIAAIRWRERNGSVELPKKGLKPGDRVRVVGRLLAGRRGRYGGEASRQHIEVLLQLFGAERQVRLDRDAVEQI